MSSPGLVARLGDCLQDDFDRLDVGLQVGSEAALVADAGAVTFLLQNPFQGVKRLHPHANRLGERWGMVGGNHKLLKVHRVVGVLAPVDDVHARDRQERSVAATEVPIQRHSERVGGGSCHGH